MNTSLYRSYTRLLAKWPIDQSKKGRDLGEYLRVQVVNAFKGTGPHDVDKCETIFQTLTRIASNRYDKAYYLPAASRGCASGLTAQECHDILSNDFIKLLEEENKGLKDKILGKKSQAKA